MRSRRLRKPERTTDQRPPEVRLDAIVREQNVNRRHRALVRVIDDLDAQPDIGPWIRAACALADAGTISDDVRCFIIQIILQPAMLAASAADAELVRLRDAMDAIERAHGLTEDESFHTHDAPPDWLELSHQWDARADALSAEELVKAGAPELATLFTADSDEFDGRAAEGREEMWGDLAPGLAPAVGDLALPDGALTAIAMAKDVDDARALMTRVRRHLNRKPDPYPYPWLVAAAALADRRIITRNALAYLGEVLLEGVLTLEWDRDGELLRLSQGMRAVEQEHDLDEGEFHVSKAPPEWRALSDAWTARNEALFAEHLRRAGLVALADLRARAPDEYQARAERGWEEMMNDGRPMADGER